MRTLLAAAASLLLAALLGLSAASPTSADPISCPAGQEQTLNPSGGGWVCQNKGGNTNLSEQTTADGHEKDRF